MYFFQTKGQKYCIDATAKTGRYGRLINHSRLHANLLPKVKSTSKAKVKSPFRKTLALRSSLDRKKYNIPNSTFKIVMKIAIVMR